MATYKRPSARTGKTEPATAAAAPPVIDDRPDVQRKRAAESDLVFGKQTFVWIGIGIALMVLGMVLMAGGGMPSPEVWDESLIYSARRITVAPIVLLAGLGVITYAILKK